MKVFLNTPDEVLAMTLAGVQCTCCTKEGNEWADEVFKMCLGEGEEAMHGYYELDFNWGIRFYVEVE